MTTPTGGRRPRPANGLLDTVEGLAVGAGRLGYGLLSLGLDLLPRQSRQHMHNAVHELSRAFATLPRDFAEIAGEEIERWAADGPAPARPARPAEASVQHIVIGGETTAPPIDTATTTVVTSPVGVGIAHIEYDPPGRDIDGEYVLIRNSGAAVANLAGWTLTDGGGHHSYVFPPVAIAPGAELRLWTRAGADDAANLYWGSRGAIWNNDGDSATLRDAAGNLVGRYSYEGKRRA